MRLCFLNIFLPSISDPTLSLPFQGREISLLPLKGGDREGVAKTQELFGETALDYG